MSYRIDLQNDRRFPIDELRLIQAAAAVLQHHDARESASLTIVLQDSAAVAALNQRHRRINAPTDVLSFAAPALPAAIDEASDYLGDIVIAHDYATAKADSGGVAASDALCLLVIHGVLHLLGFDHDTAAARELMWRAQAACLAAQGMDPDLPGRYGGGDA